MTCGTIEEKIYRKQVQGQLNLNSPCSFAYILMLHLYHAVFLVANQLCNFVFSHGLHTIISHQLYLILACVIPHQHYLILAGL